MKIRAFAVFSLAFLTLVPFTLGEVDRYEMEIKENGARFSEEIDVNEGKNIEVFRVPAHNNVEGADFYHDFKMRVTVTRFPSRKVCYIAKMDPSMPPPPKLKADLARAASQSGPLPVQVDSRLVMVTGPVNRRRLTKEILDFCGALPMYNTEVYTDVSHENGTAIMKAGRQRRQVEPYQVVNFTSCNPFKAMEKVQKCLEDDWNINCKIIDGSCFYFVTCTKIATETRKQWNCEEKHITWQMPACCDFICPTKGL